MRDVITPRRQTFREAVVEQRNIMGAVILRDLRTRFFNHGLGFIIVPMFPFVHLFALLLFNQIANRAPDYGDDPNIFLASALIPTLTFMYMSRYMAMSLIMNKPMLAYPIVGMLEVVFGRAILEIMSAIWMVVAVSLVLYAMGSNPIPNDPVQAFLAFIACMALGISAGLLVSLVTMVMDTFATVWALSLILFYITSGSFFIISNLPEVAINILSWNPVLHCSEWMRIAYYPGYPDQVLDKGYVITVAVGALVIGLLGERVLRNRLLVN